MIKKSRGKRKNKGTKKTYETSQIKISKDRKTMTFWHNDDKRLFVNVFVCPICGGHHPKGGMTVTECDGHFSIKESLRPEFARGI